MEQQNLVRNAGTFCVVLPVVRMLYCTWKTLNRCDYHKYGGRRRKMPCAVQKSGSGRPHFRAQASTASMADEGPIPLLCLPQRCLPKRKRFHGARQKRA